MKSIGSAVLRSTVALFIAVGLTVTVGERSSLGAGAGLRDRRPAPLIGAIRWDAWFEGNQFQKNLADNHWRYRLPFYAQEGGGEVRINADRQEVMEREIVLAKESNLDYWAFVYYEPNAGAAPARYNYGVRRYLASKNRNGLNFCLILQGGHLGRREQWPDTVRQLVSYFQDPAYQKVAGGRPLLFMFGAHDLVTWAGSDDAAKAALAELDAAAAKAGLPETYMVAQGFSRSESASLADRFGFDGVGAYSIFDKGDDVEYPYRDLARANRTYWEDCRESAKQVVPIVNAGCDNRPRRRGPGDPQKMHGPWYTQPTPIELAVHLHSSIQWVKTYPESTEANTILIYAWNESDEGGWLVPTLSEGRARLDAVRSAIQMQ